MNRGALALLGLLLIALLLSGAAVAIAKGNGKAEPLVAERAAKGLKEARKALNLTEISGVVSSVNATKRTFVVTADDGKTYEIRLQRIYVRASDGVIIFGGWIFKNIDVGDQVSLKVIAAKRGNVHIALSITIDGQTYVAPRLLLRS